jgi:sRNA-binding carbon storage regulator CsrA
MLTMNRRIGESIELIVNGKTIAHITLASTENRSGSIAIEAAGDVTIMRSEVIDRNPDSPPELLHNDLRRRAAIAARMRASRKAQKLAAHFAQLQKGDSNETTETDSAA